METLIEIMEMINELESEAQKLERRILKLEDETNQDGMFSS